MKQVSLFFTVKRAFLCMALAVLAAAAMMLTGGCSAESEKQNATPDELAPTAVPTAPTAAPVPTVAEEMLHGEPAAAERFIGRWVSYPDGKKITYTFDDDGCVMIEYHDGKTAEYHWSVEGDRVLMKNSDKQRIYIWSPRAVRFFSDHQYGEAAHITSLIREQLESFSGFMYVQGDYLSIGRMCMCREDRMADFDDTSLVGSWTGSDGDFLTFTADGAYHYRDEGYDYDGTYTVADGVLTLHLEGTEDSVLKGAMWGVSGRVLHLSKQYYFRDTDN